MRSGAVGDRQPRRRRQRQVRHDDGVDAAVLDRGCIQSMEVSTSRRPEPRRTTSSRLRRCPIASNPVRQLRYTDNEADVGIQHIHDLGVRYVMVTTPEAVAEADTGPSSPRWRRAARGTSISTTQRSSSRSTSSRSWSTGATAISASASWRSASWFQHGDEWAAMPAVDGPDTWQRIDVAIDESRGSPRAGHRGCGDPQSSTSRRVNIVQPVQDIEVVELPEVEVSNVEMGSSPSSSTSPNRACQCSCG